MSGRLRIERWSRERWPEEACGLLLGLRAADPYAHDPHIPAAVWVHRAVRCRNRHPEPERAYDLHPRDFLRWDRAATRAGRDVVGVWHSHPHGDPEASRADAEQAWGGWIYLIIGVSEAATTGWSAWRSTDGGGLAPVPIVETAG